MTFTITGTVELTGGTVNAVDISEILLERLRSFDAKGRPLELVLPASPAQLNDCSGPSILVYVERAEVKP